MRFHPLSTEQKEYLELRHRYEGDKRVADRIKAVLLKNEGWKNKAIAQALRIHAHSYDVDHRFLSMMISNSYAS